MKKITKIVLISFLVILLSLCLLTKSIATDDLEKYGKDESITDIDSSIAQDGIDSVWDSGTTTIHSNNGKNTSSVLVKENSQQKYTIFRILVRILLIFPEIGNRILALITTKSTEEPFTIENTLTNKYDIFNVGYLINNDNNNGKNKELLEKISNNVAVWFIAIRNLAAIIAAIVLIYIGIRIILETNSQRQARYKEMLMAWFESIIWLVFLHIFFIVIIDASNGIVSLLTEQIEKKNGETSYIEKKMLVNINAGIYDSTNNTNWIVYSILYFVLFNIQLKFFILYIKRLIKVSFLIIISPIVCATYAVDKVNDGHAQGFRNWTIELVIAVFVQPLELFVYILLISSADEIIIRNPIMGVIFFLFLGEGEKVFKSVLKYTGGGDDMDIRKIESPLKLMEPK